MGVAERAYEDLPFGSAKAASWAAKAAAETALNPDKIDQSAVAAFQALTLAYNTDGFTSERDRILNELSNAIPTLRAV